MMKRMMMSECQAFYASVSSKDMAKRDLQTKITKTPESESEREPPPRSDQTTIPENS